MSKISMAIVVAVVAALSASGCSTGGLTDQEVKLVSFGAAYVSSHTAATMLVKDEDSKITVTDAYRVIDILNKLDDSLGVFEATDDLYVSLYPLLEPVVIDRLQDETQQQLALALISSGLRIGDDVLRDNPEYLEDSEKWLTVLRSILKGLSEGTLDAVRVPEDSAMRRTLMEQYGDVPDKIDEDPNSSSIIDRITSESYRVAKRKVRYGGYE